MGTATQLTDFSDLYSDLQNRVREATGVTATENIAKRFINIGLHDMHIGFGEQLPWAERRAILRTHAPYTTGLVTIPKGSTTLTGVTDADGNPTLWNTADDFSEKNMRADGKVVVNGGPDVYEVDSVASDTSATLTTAWISSTVDGTTQTDNGAAYQYFEDEYALASDFLRPVDVRQFGDGAFFDLIGRNEFRQRYVRNKTPGAPRVCTIIDLPFSGDTTPVRKIRLHPPPDKLYLIPYTYITSNLAVTSAGVAATQLVNDTDEPIVPLAYRHTIVLQALFNWYRDRKDDARSQEAKAEYVDLMNRMTADVQIGGKKPRISPRIGPYRTQARRPWSGSSSRRFDINGRFDRMEW